MRRNQLNETSLKIESYKTQLDKITLVPTIFCQPIRTQSEYEPPYNPHLLMIQRRLYYPNKYY